MANRKTSKARANARASASEPSADIAEAQRAMTKAEEAASAAYEKALADGADEKTAEGAAEVARKASYARSPARAGKGKHEITEAEVTAIKEAREKVEREKAEAEEARKRAEEKRIAEEDAVIDEISARFARLEKDARQYKIDRANILWEAHEHLARIQARFHSWNEYCTEVLDIPLGTANNIIAYRGNAEVWAAYQKGDIGDWAAINLAKAAKPPKSGGSALLTTSQVKDMVKKRKSEVFPNDSRLVDKLKDMRKEAEKAAAKKRHAAKSPMQRLVEERAQVEADIKHHTEELKAAKTRLKEIDAEIATLTDDKRDVGDLGLKSRTVKALRANDINTVADVRAQWEDGGLASLSGLGQVTAARIRSACGLQELAAD